MTERFRLTLTRDAALVRQALGLRERVFATEMGSAPSVLAADPFDAESDHIVITDRDSPSCGVVATARLARGARYTSREFDLSRLMATGLPVAELGRTCVHPDYRGGAVGLMLFRGALAHLLREGVRYLTGTASFPGADTARHLPALRALRGEALAPEAIRPRAFGPEAIATTGPSERRAMRDVPGLIKTYLRAGAWVGEGAWVDREFNCVDVCVLLDLRNLETQNPQYGPKGQKKVDNV